MSLSKKMSLDDKKQLYLINKQNELIKMIIRQTNLEKSVVIELLKKYDNNYEKVIEHYICEDSKKESIEKEESYTSKNKGVYTEIRKFMDRASSEYRKKVEQATLREKMYQGHIKNTKNNMTCQENVNSNSKKNDNKDKDISNN